MQPIPVHWYWRHGTEREAPTLHQQRVTLGVPAVGALLDRDIDIPTASWAAHIAGYGRRLNTYETLRQSIPAIR